MPKEIVCKLAQLGLTGHMGGHVSPCNQLLDYHLVTNDGENEPSHMIILQHDSLEKAWNNDMRDRLLEQHKQGIWPEGCNQCKVNEESGTKSHRTMLNGVLEGIEPWDDQPRVLVLKHGNKCNNACRSCHPSTTAQWYKDSYKLKNEGVDIWPDDQDYKKPYKEWLKRWESYELSYHESNEDLRRVLSNWNKGFAVIDLYGGEPLLNPFTYEIIDKSIENDVAKEQVLGIHTNCTIFSDELVEKLGKFKHAILGLSFDAIGEHNDYIRHLSKWNQIEGNIEKFLKASMNHPTIFPDFSITTQILNVFYLPEICQYVHDKGWLEDEFTLFENHENITAAGRGVGNVSMSFANRVYDKKECNIMYIPKPIKEIIRKKLSDYQPPVGKNGSHAVMHMYIRDVETVINTLDYTPDDYDQHRDTFWNINGKIDGYRKQSFKNTMPEYYELFAEFYSK